MPSHTARRGLSLRRALTVVSTCAAVLAATLTVSVPADAATASPATPTATAASGGSATATSAPTVSRLQGADRYATAVQVAKATYPKGAAVAFVASGANFPDALAAGPAAAKLGAPMLLTSPTSLPSSVAAELTALHPSTVYLVGGPAALGQGVASAVRTAAAHATVTRLDGADRYATARAVVSATFPTASKAFIATGAGFADALSAAAAAGSADEPVVLVNGTAPTLDAATTAQLRKLGVKDVTIAGGPAAVSTGIQSQLGRFLGGASHVTRYGGADRYATSALIGEASFAKATTAYFASGAEFPDALAASAAAGAQHAPLFTVESGCVPNQTGAIVKSLGVSKVTLVGGPQALSARVAALTPCQAPFRIAPTPTISGRAEVGQPLTVNPGSWSPAPSHLAFQWLKSSGGSESFGKIPGATAASYTVPNGDAGDRFKVTVTASRSGYLTTGRTSTATAAASPGPELSIVAGVGDQVIPGPALKSPLSPQSVAVDAAGDLYIADYGDQVEKVTPDGDLSIFAGTGRIGTPIAGPATKSPLESVSGVAVDGGGNVYLADQGFVEMVTPAGWLSVVAGNGGFADGPTTGPALKSTIAVDAIAVDGSGALYLADQDGYVEKVAGGMLSIIAGTGTSRAPSPGPATKSSIGTDSGIAVDSVGNIYLADSDNDLIEKITAGSDILSIVAGGGHVAPTDGPATDASLSPSSIAVDGAGDLYIGDDNGYVEEVTPSGTLSVIAGNGGELMTAAGPALATSIAAAGVAVDSAGDVFVADQNGFIDRVTGGVLSIVAGLSVAPIPGPATSSPVGTDGVAVDAAGNLYVADAMNGFVEKIDTTGTLSIVAGSGSADVTTQRPTAGPATASLIVPVGVAVDASGDLYIADANGYVEKVDPSGTLSIIAGDGESGVAPVPGTALDSPLTPAAIAVDRSGNVYLADAVGYAEKVTPSGVLSIVAGNGSALGGGFGGLGGSDVPTPGPATKSALGITTGIAVDASGDLYLADVENSLVEKVTPAGVLSIVAGGGSVPRTSGPATAAQIEVDSVAVDSAGNLYIADGNGYIDKVSRSGSLSVIAGNGSQNPPTPGVALSSGVGAQALAVGSSGAVYASDWSGYLIKVVQ
ncbi:cell wall-binding repeat-containing protein [Gryllotalpicola reticulitermitis]|uniref:Cell wall-binding repeat-containing protein n=1 Tax=Gryllotalpicola reticulitermitis TaxID=1184153 RepID=A0ABV8Q6W5_9MICO